MNDVTAVILGAGKGTRMKSDTAKVLHPLMGKPLITYPVDACKKAGVGRAVVVVGHQGERVKEALESSAAGIGLKFTTQAEQRGTADAVLSAKEVLGSATGTLLILCGDVPLLRAETLVELVGEHRANSRLVTVLSMEAADPTGYGRLVRNKDGGLEKIVEQRDCDGLTLAISEVNTGTYAVELPWLWQALGRIGSDNEQGEFYLTDIIALAAISGGAGSYKLSDDKEAMGINSRLQLNEAAGELRLRINRDWIERGVEIEDPFTTWIESGVVLGVRTVIGPGCRLGGKTVIAAGVRVEQGSVITDSEIDEGTHVKPYCVITGATIGSGAAIGPFAHLRPGAKIGAQAKAGNFVEVKNSELGRGAKASHLTYLGDTTVGEGANIGAGTITCNYDGVKKSRTTIGKGAFIGSNTSLVAPVTVGDHAVIGAGSTIAKDVEAHALGIERARQRNIKGWTKKEQD